MTLTLFDHQVECAKAVEEQFAAGSQATLAVLATGTGKTIIYLHLVQKWAKAGKRVLILAHRRELIHQPLERAEEYFPELYPRMGVVMAKNDDQDAQVVVATVQTVARGRLKGEKFDYVVLDEAHHGTAKTYLKMKERFGEAKWLGMTATPFRTDGDSLVKIFESVAYRFPITAAIERGMLVPFEAYGFTLPVSVDGVQESLYGWNGEQLGNLLSAQNALEIVYEKWAEFCEGRQTICFTSSVRQAYATANYFKSRGVKAAAVEGNTPKKERDGILDAFRDGKVQVVANCQVWTEGVDVPEASACLMVAPTKSDLAYVQKLGRVLRTYEGKRDALVLDFAPLEDRNVVMAGDILGVPRVEKREREKAEKAGVMVGATRVDKLGLLVSVDPTVVIVEALKYLRKSRLAWSLDNGVAVAALSETSLLLIELPNVARLAEAEEMKSRGDWGDAKERLYQSLSGHRLWLCTKAGRNWQAGYIGSFNTMDGAMAQGELLVNAHYNPTLAKRRAKWRKRGASEGQVRYMQFLGIALPERCTQGQAAQLISHKVAINTVSRVRKAVDIQIMEETDADDA